MNVKICNTLQKKQMKHMVLHTLRMTCKQSLMNLLKPSRNEDMKTTKVAGKCYHLKTFKNEYIFPEHLGVSFGVRSQPFTPTLFLTIYGRIESWKFAVYFLMFLFFILTKWATKRQQSGMHTYHSLNSLTHELMRKYWMKGMNCIYCLVIGGLTTTSATDGPLKIPITTSKEVRKWSTLTKK